MRVDMPDPCAILEARQNADGGWGYYPGKHSALEPTAWAMLAFPAESEPWRRASVLVASWQRPDGGIRCGPAIDEPSWAASLALLAWGLNGRRDGAWRRGVDWLLKTEAAKPTLLSRLAGMLIRQQAVEQDPNLRGWPWFAADASWVEPTSFAILALRAAGPPALPGAAARIHLAERMLLDRRCKDGGWNHGNRRVLGQDLVSFPEPTAAALLALHASAGHYPLDPALEYASARSAAGVPPMAAALLRLALRVHGVPTPHLTVPGADFPDNSTLALMAMGEDNGIWPRLRELRAKA